MGRAARSAGTSPAPQPTAGRLDALTGVRALGALVVVLYHTGFKLLDGHAGVEIFYVLSGFVMVRSELARMRTKAFSARDFVIKRFARIAPALYVFVAIRLTFLLAFGTPVKWQEFIGVVLFVGNIVYALGNSPWAMVITWSMGIELQVALVNAFTLRTWGRRVDRLVRVLVTIAVCSALWRIVLYEWGVRGVRLRYVLDTRLDQLMLGVLLGIASMRAQESTATGSDRIGRAWRAARASWIGWAAMIVFTVSSRLESTLGMGYRYRFGMVVEELAVATLMWHLASVALGGDGSRPGLGSPTRFVCLRPLQWIGERSFSLYLYHSLVYLLVCRWSGLTGHAATFAALPCSLVVAHLSLRLVEGPGTRLVQRALLRPTA